MTDNNSEENRQFKRIPFDAEIFLFSKNEKYSSNLIDISLKGLLIENHQSIKCRPGDDYNIELKLSADTVINMKVTTVHSSDKNIGLKWDSIDLESLAHLRRLLELNLFDSEEIDRELVELGA